MTMLNGQDGLKHTTPKEQKGARKRMSFSCPLAVHGRADCPLASSSNKFFSRVARPRVAAQKLLCVRVRAALGSDGEFALR